MLTKLFGGNISAFPAWRGVLQQLNGPLQELLGRFWPAVVANLSFPPSSPRPSLPVLFSSSLVSCVQLRLQTRLRWWICGCSVSVCLTSWCISTGLNSLSISFCLPLFFSPTPPQVSFSLCLFVSVSLSPSLSLALIFSLSMTRHCLASCRRDGTDRAHGPTTANNNKQELSSTICPLIFTGGISEIAHLTFRPNGSAWRKQRR